MFDFNCDITPDNKEFYEMLPYMSSANLCNGLTLGTPLDILKFAKYASKNEIAIGILIDGTVENKTEDEIFANILYQISAVEGFLSTYGLKIENVKPFGKYSEKLNNDREFAALFTKAVQKYNPWFNIIVKNEEIRKILQKELFAKCALEVDFTNQTSIREIREEGKNPETLHFKTLDNAKRAYDVLKPSPITYNRVAKDF